MKIPWLTISLSILVVLIEALGYQQPLEMQRTAVLSGEVWLLVTGHLAHFGWNHLLWDLAVFIGLGFWLENRMGTIRLAVGLFISSIVIGLAILAWQPDLKTYRGLSGVDCALFGWALLHVGLAAWRRRDFSWLAITLVFSIGFVGKTLYEAIFNATIFVGHTGSGFDPVPLAHFVGLAIGLAMVLMPKFY